MDDNTDIRVLHIDSEKNWGGGQQQAVYLLERLHSAGVKTAMVAKPGSAIVTYCKDKGLPVFTIPMRGELDFLSGYRIAALCRKDGYNILQLHSSHALATGLWARLFHPGLRLVAVRRVAVPIKKNLLSQFKYKTTLLDRIICVSQGIHEIMRTDGIPDGKLVTISDGIDLTKFDDIILPDDFKRNNKIPDDHLIVGTVAAMVSAKDYPNFLNAARKLMDRKEKVTFCALGHGPDEDSIMKMAAELGLGHRFIFTGFRKDVGCFLKCFDIFVLASCREGLGTSILDAQTQGLPVVACRVGGIPEIIQDGINGLLVPPGDPDALADTIETLIHSPEMRKELGANSQRSVNDFCIRKTVEKTVTLYREVLTGNKESVQSPKQCEPLDTACQKDQT